MSDRSSRKLSLTEELRRLTGLNAARCYQCGKCSAGCPMAEEMGGLPPHAMLRLVQLDQRDRLLQSEALWLCLTCETCSARCPNEVHPARLVDGLRELSLRHGQSKAPRAISAFHRTFLDQIRSHGRIGEFGLVAGYKLRSGALFDDVFAAPGMLTRGKLHFLPQTIEGIEDVRRIFDECEQASRAAAAEPAESAGGHHGH